MIDTGSRPCLVNNWYTFPTYNKLFTEHSFKIFEDLRCNTDHISPPLHPLSSFTIISILNHLSNSDTWFKMMIRRPWDWMVCDRWWTEKSRGTRFEKYHTRLGTSFNNLLHYDRIQYQAAHPELRIYSRNFDLGCCLPRKQLQNFPSSKLWIRLLLHFYGPYCIRMDI